MRRLTLLLFPLLALAAPSAAQALPLTGGTTTLTLDGGVAKALTSGGFKIGVVAPAKAAGGGIGFPISGGSLDPATATGRIPHRGGISLRRNGRTVRLTDFLVTLGKPPTLSAKVNGGSRLTAIRLVVGKAKIARDGIDYEISNVAVHLSTPGAKALNKAFGVKVFRPALKLGEVVVSATPRDLVFSGGATSLALDPGAAQALQSQGITPGLVEGATANPDGSFAFPITKGSTINAKTLAGTVGHTGGISLTKGSTVVTLTAFDVIVDSSPALAAKLNGGMSKAEILSLDVGALQGPTVADGTVTVGGIVARLTKAAADALNQAFATTAFTEGLTIGTAKVAGRL